LISRNIKLKGPKIKGPDYSIEGNIPGVNINTQNTSLRIK